MNKVLGTSRAPRSAARVALAVVMAVGALVAWQSPGLAAGPTVVDAQTNCADYGLLEFKIDEQPKNTTYTQGSLSITISNYSPDDENDQSFDWASNFGIDKVLVKAGAKGGSHLYNYDEATGDTGLVPPTNPANNQPYQVSHVSFCYDRAGAEPPSPGPSDKVGGAGDETDGTGDGGGGTGDETGDTRDDVCEEGDMEDGTGGAGDEVCGPDDDTGDAGDQPEDDGASDDEVTGTVDTAEGGDQVLGGERISRGAEAEAAAEVLPVTGLPLVVLMLLASGFMIAGLVLVHIARTEARHARTRL